jgi:hypothetical protein
MNLNEPLIPAFSLAGFKINENIEEAVSRIPSRHRVERPDRWVIIDDGFLTIAFDEKGYIYCITCDSRYGVKYKDKLWAGMSVRDVLNNSTKQAVYIDFVIVDDIQGIGLPLPPEADDFERITDFLSLDHVFKELSVFLKQTATRRRRRGVDRQGEPDRSRRVSPPRTSAASLELGTARMKVLRHFRVTAPSVSASRKF